MGDFFLADDIDIPEHYYLTNFTLEKWLESSDEWRDQIIWAEESVKVN